ncbi:Fe3+-hydroxamate ABC transporter,periplasmic protein [Actinobacillus equuli]|nr:Fe3+-hydroxamate ABC transporter,periplasmic protein [Actinobacillus equuli]
MVIISGTEMGTDKMPKLWRWGLISVKRMRKNDSPVYSACRLVERTGGEKGNVYGIYHTASRSITDLASAQFMAKTLYPEQFKDIDPEKTYLDFHRQYLPVVPQGTFLLS